MRCGVRGKSNLYSAPIKLWMRFRLWFYNLLPLGQFTLNQVYWNRLGLSMCISMVKRPSGPHGFANGRNKLSWTLQLPKLSNYMYLSDALQISIIRTVWACRCATTWSFALRTHMGVSMGAINFWNPLLYRLSYIAYRPYMMLLHCLQLLAES